VYNISEGINMQNLNRNCKTCDIPLTTDNTHKNGMRNGKIRYYTKCKPCRVKIVTKYNVGNPKRKAYINAYQRKIGVVREYPCETCSTLCYKKYVRAFCSDKCRFLAYVDKQEGGCWIWTGSLNHRGYGKFSWKKQKTALASRVSYELFKEPIEDQLFICHTCDVPSCVNPDHLFAGSHMENMLDMIDKGRQNAKLSPDQVWEIRKLWEKGWSQSKLMEKFKIASPTISNIVNRRSWKHI